MKIFDKIILNMIHNISEVSILPVLVNLIDM